MSGSRDRRQRTAEHELHWTFIEPALPVPFWKRHDLGMREFMPDELAPGLAAAPPDAPERCG